jgi:hypothetical protein
MAAICKTAPFGLEVGQAAVELHRRARRSISTLAARFGST